MLLQGYIKGFAVSKIFMIDNSRSNTYLLSANKAISIGLVG